MKQILYLRQALHMMKEEKLFSGIYIAGTALHWQLPSRW